MDAVSRAESIALDGLLQRKPLLGNPSAGWLAVASLARDCGLNSFPRIKCHYRPITAKGFVAATLPNALPGPGTRLSIMAGIFQPDAEYIVIGIGV